MGIRKSGFTLIELLVVVSIISILSLIAMPNLTLSLTRAKVARVRNDMRVLANGVELYMVDYNTYPRTLEDSLKTRISSENSKQDIFNKGTIHYETPESPWGMSQVDEPLGTSVTKEMGYSWLLGSVGPDQSWFNLAPLQRSPGGDGESDKLSVCVSAPYRDYDATNGTLSAGNIFRTNINPELLNPHPKLYEDVYSPMALKK